MTPHGGPRQRVVLLGAGTIGTTHAEVVREHDGFDLVGIVDPQRDSLDVPGGTIATSPDLEVALAAGSPDLVVVATPTGSHVSAIADIMELTTTCRILVEKPAAASREELAHLAQLLGGSGGGRDRLLFAYHMAHAPEVAWAAARHDDWRAGGGLERVVSVFQDPYASDVAGYRRRLGSSWLDSGINALSVIARFATVGRRRSHRIVDEDGLVEQAVIELASDDGRSDALVVTSWHATASAKSTRLRYTSGVEVLLDHTSVSAFAMRGGGLVERFGTDGSASRRIQHYWRLYDAMLGAPDRLLGWDTTHRLLDALLGTSPYRPG